MSKYLKQISLICLMVLFFLGCQKKDSPIVGFDIDDTVLFSSPAFAGNVSKTGINWEKVNVSDHLSLPLVETVAFIKTLDPACVFFITAREKTATETLSARIEEVTGVSASHVFFSKEKDGLIKSLHITVFYGDSDGDIEAAVKAGVIGIRVPRRPESTYTKGNTPGKYGEWVLPMPTK